MEHHTDYYRLQEQVYEALASGWEVLTQDSQQALLVRPGDEPGSVEVQRWFLTYGGLGQQTLHLSDEVALMLAEHLQHGAAN